MNRVTFLPDIYSAPLGQRETKVLLKRSRWGNFRCERDADAER